MESGRLRIQFQRFGANFADRWPRWTGARLIEVQLHSKSFGGTLKWPLKGGSRLIEVTATAGLTVHNQRHLVCSKSVMSLSSHFFNHDRFATFAFSNIIFPSSVIKTKLDP